MSHLFRICALVACLAPLGACTTDEDAPATTTLEDAVTTLTGTVPANGWVTRTVTLTTTSDLGASLDWAQHADDLNLFLHDANNVMVVYANGTTARPEKVAATSLAAGTYTFGIKNHGTTATTYTLSVTITPNFAPAYPGDPRPGTVFWGAAVEGNADPGPRHETPSGHPLAVHRTYWQWSQRTGSMITMASGDLAHHRLPWVSIKPPPPPSWADMGNGVYDAQIDQMLNALKALPGPVWLTVHHEPEGGGGTNAPDDPGGPSAHIAMNRRVRARITALGVHNVALAPVLMSWTFTTASQRNPDVWWAPGIYDFFGVDHYEKNEVALTDATWAKVRQWSAARGADIAVGEWGIHGSDAAAGELVRAWYDAAINSSNDGGGARVVGLSAFDSNLNSSDGGWELQGAQLAVFNQLMGDPRTASIDDN
ncbi:MAG: hypothetical protein ABI678_10765 [Kofleriaceae bacterium]